MSEDNVIRGRVNWKLLRELNTAGPDTKHFMGTTRCVLCSDEHRACVPTSLWQAHPCLTECARCHQLTCVFVDPREEGEEGEEPYEYFVVWPEGQGPED